MLPLQLKMGAALVELSEESEVTVAELKRVRELKHQLERAERRLAVKRDVRDELELEASRISHEL